jgi:hypothetical protein
MSVLKWVLAAVGVIFLLLIALIVGGYFWAQNIEAVKLTKADLDVGGSYSAEERQTLVTACEKQSKAGADEKACSCLADKAATDMSRFERLALIAGFETSPSKFVALIKGATDSGISKTDIDAIEAKAKERIKGALEACHISAPAQ